MSKYEEQKKTNKKEKEKENRSKMVLFKIHLQNFYNFSASYIFCREFFPSLYFFRYFFFFVFFNNIYEFSALINGQISKIPKLFLFLSLF